MSKLRPYKVRFHLGAGRNYMKWRIESTLTGNVGFYDPQRFVINMAKCRFVNHQKTAEKIHDGANKTVCAWIECAQVEVAGCVEGRKAFSADEIVHYNPRVAPYWYMLNWGQEHEIMDGSTTQHCTTRSNKVYLSDSKQPLTILWEKFIFAIKNNMAGKKGFKPNRGSAPVPRFMTSNRENTCAETGLHIAIGDRILYNPTYRKAYCAESETYKKHIRMEEM